jgi:DNA-binding CsgD family transcriptional regulator
MPGTGRRPRLLSQGDAAENLCRKALAHLARTRMRPGLARAHLLYGEWPRRERRRAEARDQQLTAQERQIAQLARAGMSNPEIGARLFLSPRTVQYHLGNVFAKLGISSGNQLGLVLPADAVTGLPGAFIPNGRGVLKPGTGARQMSRVSSDPPAVAKTSSLSTRVMGCRPAG